MTYFFLMLKEPSIRSEELMIGPLMPGLVFSAVIIILSIYKPEECRILLGFFFIFLGLGVNLTSFLSQPYFVYENGMEAWLPLFRVLTESIIGLNPVLFGVFLIIFEVLIGLALLGSKTWVSLGIYLAAFFILILIPVYYSQMAWAVSVIGVLLLLRKKYEVNFVDLIRSRVKK